MLLVTCPFSYHHFWHWGRLSLDHCRHFWHPFFYLLSKYQRLCISPRSSLLLVPPVSGPLPPALSILSLHALILHMLILQLLNLPPGSGDKKLPLHSAAKSLFLKHAFQMSCLAQKHFPVLNGILFMIEKALNAHRKPLESFPLFFLDLGCDLSLCK